MANIEIVDLQPAFNKQIFKRLVSRYGLKVFSNFCYPKNNPEKMSQIEEWLRNTKSFFHMMPQTPPTIPMIIMTICMILVILIMMLIGISPQSNKVFSAIVGILMYLVVIGTIIYFSFTIPSSKLLETLEKIRDFNLIDYHVEPYQCRILVFENGYVKEQVGIAGITDSGEVISLTPELTNIELTTYRTIILNQDFVKQKISEAYKKKFGEKQQTTEVILKL